MVTNKRAGVIRVKASGKADEAKENRNKNNSEDTQAKVARLSACLAASSHLEPSPATFGSDVIPILNILSNGK